MATRPGLPATVLLKIVTFSGSRLTCTAGDHFVAGAFRLAGSVALLVERYVACVPLSTQAAYRLPTVSTDSTVKLRGLFAPGIWCFVKVLAPSVDTATMKPSPPPGT